MNRHRGYAVRYSVGLDNMRLPISPSSMDLVTVAAGQVLASGAVVGQIAESAKYAVFDPGADDGTAIAAGVLYEDVDAGAGDATARVLDGPCEVYLDKLAWKAGLTDEQKATGLADLASRGVKAR